MILLYKILSFVTLLKISVQNHLPESAEKSSNSNSVDPERVISEVQLQNTEEPVRNESARISEIHVFIEFNPTITSEFLKTSSSGQISSMGHSPHVSDISSHIRNTQSSRLQGVIQSRGNTHTLAIHGNNFVSLSPLLKHINGVSELLFGNSGVQSSVAAAKAKPFRGSSNSYGNTRTWISSQDGNQGNIIIVPIISEPSVINNAASLEGNPVSEENFNRIRIVDQQALNNNNWAIEANTQLSNNNLAMRGNTQSEDLQPDHLEIKDNNFNTQEAMEYQTSSTHTHSQHHHAKQKLQITADRPTKLSTPISNNGLYASEFSERKGQKVIIPIQEPNPQFIATLPVKQLRLIQETIGYRPNIQYYFHQADTRDIMHKILSGRQTPAFINTFKPGQVDIQLTRPQIEIYKQYLIETGLINLKPFRLIFGKNNLLKLPFLHWMVVNLKFDLKPYQSPSIRIYERDTFLSPFIQTPVPLLVPILKIRQGLKKTMAGTKTMFDGLQGMSGGVLHMAHEGLKAAKVIAGTAEDNSNIRKI